MAKRARVKTVVNEHVFLDRFLMKQLCERQNLRDSKAVLGLPRELFDYFPSV